MCQPLPGLRCAGDQSKKVLSSMSNYLLAVNSGDKSQSMLAFARFYSESVEYDATARGKDELYKLINNPITNPEEIPALKERLVRGEQRFNERDEAYKTSNPSLVSPIPPASAEIRASYYENINRYVKTEFITVPQFVQELREEKVVVKVFGKKDYEYEGDYRNWETKLNKRLEAIQSLPANEKAEFGKKLQEKAIQQSFKERKLHEQAIVKEAAEEVTYRERIEEARAKALVTRYSGSPTDDKPSGFGSKEGATRSLFFGAVASIIANRG